MEHHGDPRSGSRAPDPVLDGVRWLLSLQYPTCSTMSVLAPHSWELWLHLNLNLPQREPQCRRAPGTAVPERCGHTPATPSQQGDPAPSMKVYSLPAENSPECPGIQSSQHDTAVPLLIPDNRDYPHKTCSRQGLSTLCLRAWRGS